MKVYVASSWRNESQQQVVRSLRAVGYEVYDCRHPHYPDFIGGAWTDINPPWQSWTAQQQIDAYDNEIAQRELAQNLTALRAADVCVMVQPCGGSAALELGYVIGAGKATAVLMADGQEPEPMLRMADKLTTSIEGVLVWLAVLVKKRAAEARLAAAPKPANLPVSPVPMSLTERIALVLREGRDPRALDDPGYFDRKAEVFDLIADEDEKTAVLVPAEERTARALKVADTREMAIAARRRAATLRALRAPAIGATVS